MDFLYHEWPFGKLKDGPGGRGHLVAMISRHPQLRQQVGTLAELLASAPAHVQKIYSTSRYLCLQLRFPRRTVNLYVGRGGGHEGLWLGGPVPPPALRVRDTWLEWCRKNLSGALLGGCELDPCDRAVALVFRRGGEVCSWQVFWAGRTSYFAFHRSEGDEWFLSWRGKEVGPLGFGIFSEVGRRDVPLPVEEAPTPVEAASLLEEESKAALRAMIAPKTKIRSAERKIAHIRADLDKIRAWQPFQEWVAATDPVAWENAKEVTHGPLKYKFPPGLGAWQKKDWLFQQAKRLRAAEAKQARRLEEALAHLEGLGKPVEEASNPLKPVRPVWRSAPISSPPAPIPAGEYVVHAVEGGRVGVGRSARGNDQLRKEWAGPEDWWVHAAAGPSAHAVLRMDGGAMPTPSHFAVAATLLARQSSLKGDRLEVIVTQVKNLRGVPGAPGLVTYKKQKTLLCVLADPTQQA